MNADRIRKAAARARKASQEAMLDICRITRPGAAGTLNETTGLYDRAAGTLVYAGRCRAPRPDTATVVKRDDRPLTEAPMLMKVPTGEGPFRIGDVVTITKFCRTDGAATGRTWRVTAVPVARWSVDQPLEVEEVIADA